MSYDLEAKQFRAEDVFPIDEKLSLLDVAALRRAFVEGLRSMTDMMASWERTMQPTTLATCRQYFKWLEKVTPLLNREMEKVEKEAEFEALSQLGCPQEEPQIN